MDDPLRITVDESPLPDERRIVGDGLLAFNIRQIGPPHYVALGVFVRGHDGTVRGGLVGHMQWQWLYVEKFWLPEELRGRGLGARVLRAAEEHACARGCRGASLDTFDFQALPFYRKQGYELFGTLDGYPAGRRQYFLRKDLSAER